ncbi:unnamed protein product [Arctia plantaginis]|uniref:Multiple inositol polyphosphate phosphatase 1 n=1 Tax=Arctia plantaginis TaxID=874455 RepID=A0A8S0ZV70_ARCPL|nr:unnamed protein product [Arctia plantaginis]
MLKLSIISKLIIYLLVGLVQVRGCYWNSRCSYELFGSKTPYDTVRGDIRDYPVPENCEAISIWALNRHGNRNPGSSVAIGMRAIADLKDEIIASYEAGDSKLCSQDIDNFRNWYWNDTIDVSHSYLTGVGYEELFGIGKRIQEKYPDLFNGQPEEFYFRPTNEQRTVTSCMAFVQGITNGLNLNVTVEGPRDIDDIIRPYSHCDRYQREVKEGEVLAEQLDYYFQSEEYVAVQAAVQERLGIKTPLDVFNIFSIYEMCRFYRSWTEVLQSPWCAAFSDKDLLVLEYYDDIRHYYRNGYGSKVNVNLGKPPLKDLYENFKSAVNGKGRKVTSYFTHDTMMEMTLSALGVYKDEAPLQSTVRNADRIWRTSFIGAFSSNLIAVLNSCNDAGPTYKVQLFINEKETEICPVDGCTWEEFQDKFQAYSTANLDFCSVDNENNSTSSINRILSWSRRSHRY